MKEQFEMSLKKRQTCCAGNFAIFLNLQFAISSSLDVCKHFAQVLNCNFDSSSMYVENCATTTVEEQQQQRDLLTSFGRHR